jgi:hypothetical protein
MRLQKIVQKMSFIVSLCFSLSLLLNPFISLSLYLTLSVFLSLFVIESFYLSLSLSLLAFSLFLFIKITLIIFKVLNNFNNIIFISFQLKSTEEESTSASSPASAPGMETSSSAELYQEQFKTSTVCHPTKVVTSPMDLIPGECPSSVSIQFQIPQPHLGCTS